MSVRTIFGETLTDIMDRDDQAIVRERSQVSLCTTVAEGDQPFIPYKGDANYHILRNGRPILDLTSQYGVAPFGNYSRAHRNMYDLLQEFGRGKYAASVDPDPGHRLEVLLKQRLLEFLPEGYEFILFELSGATANNVALTIAEHISPKRNQWGSFERAFHGRHQPAKDLTASNTGHKAPGYRPSLSTVYFPYPSSSKDIIRLLEFINANEERTFSIENLSAFMMEFIQGEGGMYVPRESVMHNFVEALQEKGVLVIADECQTFIRTGRRCAFEHYDVKPDMITISKIFSWCGFPMGAVIVRKGLIKEGTLPLGWHSGSQLGQPLPCLAGLVMLETAIKENLVEHAQKIGSLFIEKLQSALKDNPLVKEIRGKGLMIGIDIVNLEGKPDAGLLGSVVDACLEKGVYVGTAGNKKHETVVRLLPPLMITAHEIDFAVKQIQDAFDLFFEAYR
ncbi:MAG: aspartate aminotransferase family protein [Candidatus Niyogibacteria bacterium]|nr:aspartate aminotransferase family protein [Candidatus Niyogibacteria bacterium]